MEGIFMGFENRSKIYRTGKTTLVRTVKFIENTNSNKKKINFNLDEINKNLAKRQLPKQG